MRRQILALAPALMLLGACSQGAQDDLNNSLDRTGDSLENAANDAGRTIDRAADDAGRAIDNTADDVGDRAERIGNAIDNETR
ncbi:hypothetical protein AB2M62_15300 [Sphingomonas sp. MMS12-HWE2-04]|uniref:hypothetical protein n=1 Tax=Sphingomonas sp. MMS12-HWE2-04 TaxID=3234199 RepID=UPI0038507FB0